MHVHFNDERGNNAFQTSCFAGTSEIRWTGAHKIPCWDRLRLAYQIFWRCFHSRCSKSESILIDCYLPNHHDLGTYSGFLSRRTLSSLDVGWNARLKCNITVITALRAPMRKSEKCMLQQCSQFVVSLKSSFRGLRKSWINLLTIPLQQASRQGQFAVESKEQHYSVIFYLSVVAYSPHAEIYANRNFVQTGPLLHGLLTLKRFANFISTINCFSRRSSEKSERQGP